VRRTVLASLLATLAASLAACGSSTAPPAVDASTPNDAAADVGSTDVAATDLGAPGDASTGPTEPVCDPVSPTRCGLPFPNDYWTVADTRTPTGRRVRFDAEMLPRATPRWFDDHDGFSPGATLLAHLPGAVAEGLPSPLRIEDSLAPMSPTVLLDTTDGSRVAHFAEVDVTTPDVMRRALMIRPTTGLVPGRRYVVVLRGVRDAMGAVIAPSPAYVALRDNTPDPALSAAMRARYGRIFETLTQANIPRGDTQLAWDFTVASRANITAPLLAVRDAALSAAGPMGPSHRIINIRQNPREGVAMTLEGELTVPLYLTRAEAGGALRFAPDGSPMPNGTATYPFWMLVPTTALTRPAGLLQYGHGLLGSGEDLLSDPAVRAFATQANLIVFGMDLQGMSRDDTSTIVTVISGSDIGRFREVIDRQHQGMVNALLLMRSAAGRMVTDPMLQSAGRSLIDPTRRFYYGGSQGGIFGATYMAITPDVRRGVLAVPGQAYALMLNRSINFTSFEMLLRARFPDPLDVQRVIGLVQMLWDRTEPSGWTPYLRTDRVPGTVEHEVLLLSAIGDRQVPTLAAHLMARTIGGVPNLAPLNRPVFGLTSQMGSHTGSAMIEFDFGLPEPLVNTPAAGTPDPHGRIGESPAAFVMGQTWLETGTTQNTCEGPCDPR